MPADQRPIIAFLPCRAGSKRIVGKNTRPFAGQHGGLTARKLQHLVESRGVDRIIVSTDDDEVMALAESARARSDKPIDIIARPPELAISDSLDKFVAYIPAIVPDGHLCWTHVTSPFFDAVSLDRAIEAYRKNVIEGSYDSLMGVSEIRTFMWHGGKCISHDRSQVKWPQTQDLEPFHEVNSSIFMIDIALMRALNDRVGPNPYLFVTTKREAVDIDWPEDFDLAERMALAGS